jgi:hypothetical protein
MALVGCVATSDHGSFTIAANQFADLQISLSCPASQAARAP